MVIKFFLFMLLISVQLFSKTNLNKVYYIDTKEITLKTIIPSAEEDIKLFNIHDKKHSKKVRRKDLLNLLKSHGYDNFVSKSSYIKFILKSPIDTSKIKNKIKEHYKKHYPNIEILSLHVEPRSYIETIPKDYTIKMKKNSFLQSSGVISIKTPKHKKIFFNYLIRAKVLVFISRDKIKRDSEISVKNVKQEIIFLDKFRALPYQGVDSGQYQAKHHINKNKIITIRDITELFIVKRNADVLVTMNKNNIKISFSAKALQNGKLNDIIKVQKANSKTLKVKVTGRNTAEMK